MPSHRVRAVETKILRVPNRELGPGVGALEPEGPHPRTLRTRETSCVRKGSEKIEALGRLRKVNRLRGGADRTPTNLRKKGPMGR